MTQVLCPLCGRYFVYDRFDPSSFDDDLYGVEVAGLGRGRGFSFSEKFSLLDDDHLCNKIAERSRRILHFIEGEELPAPGAYAKLQRNNRDWVAWGETTKKTLSIKDAEINRLRGENRSLSNSLNRESGESSAQAAENEELSNLLSQWQSAYRDLKAECDSRGKIINGLRLQNRNLRDQIDEDEDDEDSAAAAEMGEILDRINSSSTADFDNLSDAVDWLLEG